MNDATSTSPDDRVVERDADDRIVCACRDVTLGAMRNLLDLKSDLTFDGFLAETGVGGDCTACLLDAEHYFVHLPRRSGGSGPSGSMMKRLDHEPLKRRFYRLIDGLAPKVPYKLFGHVPILAGAQVEQWLWMANHSLMYDGEFEAPPYRIDLTLRNAGGRVVWHDRRNLDPGTEWRENITEKLICSDAGAIDGDLFIGWLEIVRRAKCAGCRGTTRSQIEIIARGGSCAVHSQAAGLIDGGQITLLARPAEDRVFVSIVNAGARTLQLDFVYPIAFDGNDVGAARSQTIIIPPKGANLHEVVLTPEEVSWLAGRLFTIRWRCAGFYKAHVIIASPDLSRFSIDHA